MNIVIIMIIMIMITRARPRAQYWSTVTMVARTQRLSSPLFSWQRFSTIKINLKFCFFLTTSYHWNHLQYRISVEAALAMVRSARPSVQPNPGFMAQLRYLIIIIIILIIIVIIFIPNPGAAQVLVTIIMMILSIFIIITNIIDPTMDSWQPQVF